LNQALSVTQLTGLEFRPTAGLSAASSTFTYTVTDPAGNSTGGNATLTIQSQTSTYDATAPLMTNNDGALVFDQVISGQMAFTQIGGLGPEWEFEGSGYLSGDGKPGFLIRNTGSVDGGKVAIGEVNNGAASFNLIGGLGPEWSFAGNGDFLGHARGEFLIHNTGSVAGGTLAVGEVNGGAARFTVIGGVGAEGECAGTR